MTAILEEARDRLFQELASGESMICPCCDQNAKIYPRSIHATLAKALITLCLAQESNEFIHAPSLSGDTHEISQLMWWDLIEEELRLRPDGGRAGYWRPTIRGLLFVTQDLLVSKYAYVYNGQVLRLDGEEISIVDALGDRFDFRELMSR